MKAPTTSKDGKTNLEPWVSIDDVATYLGVRKDSIYRWIEQRHLPATKIGKLWKLRLSEVDAWMHARRSDPVAISAPTPRAQMKRGPKRVVMVIDDDELVRDTLTDFLEDEGFRVVVASDGAEALVMLGTKSLRPDLIVLDLQMPRLDGWQFLERQSADANLAPIPVIVVTAVVSPKVMCAKVLPKPLRLGELAMAIDALLPVAKISKGTSAVLSQTGGP